jgi:hypothetical protein
MFAVLRQFTELEDSNIFAKNQGRSQWPDITPYDKSRGFWAKTASFDVAVRFPLQDPTNLNHFCWSKNRYAAHTSIPLLHFRRNIFPARDNVKFFRQNTFRERYQVCLSYPLLILTSNLPVCVQCGEESCGFHVRSGKVDGSVPA